MLFQNIMVREWAATSPFAIRSFLCRGLLSRRLGQVVAPVTGGSCSPPGLVNTLNRRERNGD